MENENLKGFEILIRIMNLLRGPKGCPWDREQTKDSMKWYLIEECYEVLDAIETESSEKLKEELGDTLFQILFIAQLSEEQGDFNIFDVIRSVKEKMIRRHPHVFKDKEAKDALDVKKIWWEIKEKEKAKEGKSILDSIPCALPSLLKSFRILKRAAHAGYDSDKTDDVLHKFDRRIEKFKESLKSQDKDRIEDELGKVLFSLTNIGRLFEINPEEALRKKNIEFSKWFKTEKELIG
ncbi:MAG: nucleoside triphosphate pyrophosphohydrolase [Thermodesulfobacteriota bacterium]|nr:nucleoside triphosphate pyrophosphohydrolase [Thermodesulfobacteriota bacterium]